MQEIAIRRPGFTAVQHGYDWGPFLKIARPAVSWTRRLRVLGAGFDISWNQNIRFYTVSLGAPWLFNIAWGYRAGPIEQEPAHPPRSYIQPTIFGLDICYSRKQGWRFFFRGRRLFYKPQKD
jgi:hypothetical protein